MMLGDKIEKWFHITQRNTKQYKEAVIDFDELIKKANRVNELEKELMLTEYRLLQRFIQMQPKTYRKRNTNWVIVRSFLQYYTSKQGSTSSRQKCIDLGIDPDAYEMESFADYRNEVNNV